MARNDGPGGPPHDPYDSDGEPTQYGSYPRSEPAAYSETEPTSYGYGYGAPDPYGQQPDRGQEPAQEPPAPWYRSPAGLVSLGAIGVILLAGIVYAIVSLTGSDSSTPTSGSSTTSGTSASSTTSTTESGSVAPVPTDGTQTVTETGTPSTTTTESTTTTTTTSPTTTTTSTTTSPPSTSTSTSTSTVTQTVTVAPTLIPTLPSLGGGS